MMTKAEIAAHKQQRAQAQALSDSYEVWNREPFDVLEAMVKAYGLQSVLRGLCGLCKMHSDFPEDASTDQEWLRASQLIVQCADQIRDEIKAMQIARILGKGKQ